jgi:hypothetical protein
MQEDYPDVNPKPSCERKARVWVVKIKAKAVLEPKFVFMNKHLTNNGVLTVYTQSVKYIV